MDTKIEIKQEDCFPGDMDLQTKREFFHKVITVKSHSSSVLPDDNGCDMAIKTEIKSETSFTERDCFVKHFVKEIEFEAVTCRNTCKTVSETKIEEQALDSDFGLEKETEFLTKDPVMKAKNNDSDHEMDDKIEIKEEPWWLERETSAACDNIKDEDFPPVISSRLCIEGASSAVSGKSPLIAAELSVRETSFYTRKDNPENERQKSDIKEMGTVEEHVLLEQPGKCSEGEEMDRRPLLVKQKTLIHKSTRTLKCEICGKSFVRLSHLKTHNLIHEDEKRYQCKTCDKSFTQLSHLKTHNLMHEGKKAHKCKTCDKSFTQLSSLKKHYLIHEGKKPYQCKTCNNSFTQLSNMKRHYLIHEGKKPHKCKTCDRSFTRLSDLNQHSSIHEGKKPHQCTICDKSYTQLSSLKAHYFIHEGKKPHKCKICDKSFTWSSDLKKHNLIHEGKKPYQCRNCDRSFTHKSNLKSHYLIHEGKKPHQCKTCDQSFTQLSHLKRHYLKHESKK